MWLFECLQLAQKFVIAIEELFVATKAPFQVLVLPSHQYERYLHATLAPTHV